MQTAANPYRTVLVVMLSLAFMLALAVFLCNTGRDGYDTEFWSVFCWLDEPFLTGEDSAADSPRPRWPVG